MHCKVVQPDGLWPVQRMNVGVMFNVGSYCTSVICSPSKAIVSVRCADFFSSDSPRKESQLVKVRELFTHGDNFTLAVFKMESISFS